MLMTCGEAGDPLFTFMVSAAEKDIRREKEKARALRKTQWWQRQVFRGVCHYCRKTVPALELTMDHVVPLIRGGRSTKGNVVPACKDCNNRKKYLLPIEWTDYLNDCSKAPHREDKLDPCNPIEEDSDERM
jgi:5-methylcytosine-specific restriction enzyme A